MSSTTASRCDICGVSLHTGNEFILKPSIPRFHDDSLNESFDKLSAILIQRLCKQCYDVEQRRIKSERIKYFLSPYLRPFIIAVVIVVIVLGTLTAVTW
jgi:hypothetical protein